MLVAINFVWGTSMLTSKLGLREFPPILFASLRVSFMVVFCLPWLRRYPGQMRTLFLVALTTGAAGFGFLNLGLGLSKDVSTVAILAQLNVPFATILSVLMLGEVIHWRRKLGIALAFAGVLIIGFDPRALGYWPGLVCTVLNAAGVALGFINIKRLRDVPPMAVQAWIAVFSLPVLLLLSLLFESGQLPAVQHATLPAWGAVLFAAVGSSIVAYGIFFHLLKFYPVSRITPMNVTSVVFAMLLGVLINHDHITSRMWLGATVTLAGVLIIEMRTRMAIVPE